VRGWRPRRYSASVRGRFAFRRRNHPHPPQLGDGSQTLPHHRVGGAARVRGRFLRWIRNFAANTYITCMNKIPSPEQAARLERQRLAAEDGAKALQEVAERSVAVRENMARLRALRLAKEAVRTQIATENQRANSRRDRR
jgi:hypothetical protein